MANKARTSSLSQISWSIKIFFKSPINNCREFKIAIAKQTISNNLGGYNTSESKAEPIDLKISFLHLLLLLLLLCILLLLLLLLLLSLLLQSKSQCAMPRSDRPAAPHKRHLTDELGIYKRDPADEPGMPRPLLHSVSESQMRGRTRLGSTVTRSPAIQPVRLAPSTTCTMCWSSLRSSLCLSVTETKRCGGSVALETIPTRILSLWQTHGSNFLVVTALPTAIRVGLSASGHQAKWEYIFTTGHDMAHILSSCPLKCQCGTETSLSTSHCPWAWGSRPH